MALIVSILKCLKELRTIRANGALFLILKKNEYDCVNGNENLLKFQFLNFTHFVLGGFQ